MFHSNGGLGNSASVDLKGFHDALLSNGTPPTPILKLSLHCFILKRIEQLFIIDTSLTIYGIR